MATQDTSYQGFFFFLLYKKIDACPMASYNMLFRKIKRQQKRSSESDTMPWKHGWKAIKNYVIISIISIIIINHVENENVLRWKKYIIQHRT